METEMIGIVDEQGKRFGSATREEVHQKGFWHETFHCWVISRESKGVYIHFQIRSPEKKDFPNLLDIAAAGHLLAQETVEDGVREVQEELGLSISFQDLIPLGVVKDRLQVGTFLDNEICHVFLYENSEPIEAYNLQLEEVAGIVKAEFQSFYEFCFGEREELQVEGYRVNPMGERLPLKERVQKSEFVPHEPAYFQEIITRIQYMKRRNEAF